ncbi:hypothetical protein G9A89_010866 [Geosiphon pyriformis]|nr:hypothetical protein G9A89_010866 [Geosiphon pyriformis]
MHGKAPANIIEEVIKHNVNQQNLNTNQQGTNANRQGLSAHFLSFRSRKDLRQTMKICVQNFSKSTWYSLTKGVGKIDEHCIFAFANTHLPKDNQQYPPQKVRIKWPDGSIRRFFGCGENNPEELVVHVIIQNEACKSKESEVSKCTTAGIVGL